MTVSGLTRKLGIKPGMRVLVKDAPSHFSSLLGSLPEGVKRLKTSTAKVECVIAFVRCKADVQAVAPVALDAVVEAPLDRSNIG